MFCIVCKCVSVRAQESGAGALTRTRNHLFAIGDEEQHLLSRVHFGNQSKERMFPFSSLIARSASQLFFPFIIIPPLSNKWNFRSKQLFVAELRQGGESERRANKYLR